MEISLRDERGQALVEYILTLVVTVALVLGGIYQLNSAFKTWANNYFGDYLSCLLETGELPTISGGGGDAGICNEIFKPFSLSEGRPLVSGYKAPEGGGGGGSGAASPETKGAGYAGGGNSGGGSFAGSSARGGNQGSQGSSKKKAGAGAYTGSTATSSYGSNSRSSMSKVNAGVKERLDTRFAFVDQREAAQKRSTASQFKRPGEAGARAPRSRVKRTDLNKLSDEAPSSGMTFPDFIRFLIIAAILLALFLFLGGQALQISKSSE